MYENPQKRSLSNKKNAIPKGKILSLNLCLDPHLQLREHLHSIYNMVDRRKTLKRGQGSQKTVVMQKNV